MLHSPQKYNSKLIIQIFSLSMKAFLALFLLFAAVSAATINDWKNCGSSKAQWIPLTLRTEKSTSSDVPCYVSICGLALVPFTANGYNLDAKKWGFSLYSKKGNIKSRSYVGGEQFCFDYTFKIPSVATSVGSFDLYVSALDQAGNTLGCMQFDSSYLF